MTISAGKFVPEPVLNWTDVDYTSDEALSMTAFAGIGAVRLRSLSAHELSTQPNDGADYVIDFSELVSLEVRKGFERFGAAAYFNGDLQATRIHWSMHDIDVRLGEPLWSHASGCGDALHCSVSRLTSTCSKHI